MCFSAGLSVIWVNPAARHAESEQGGIVASILIGELRPVRRRVDEVQVQSPLGPRQFFLRRSPITRCVIQGIDSLATPPTKESGNPPNTEFWLTRPLYAIRAPSLRDFHWISAICTKKRSNPPPRPHYSSSRSRNCNQAERLHVLA